MNPAVELVASVAVVAIWSAVAIVVSQETDSQSAVQITGRAAGTAPSASQPLALDAESIATRMPGAHGA